MKKSVPNSLVIVSQLLIVGIFFAVSFEYDSNVVSYHDTIENENLNKIAMSVSLLFEEGTEVDVVSNINDSSLNELPSMEDDNIVLEEKEISEKETVTSSVLTSVAASKYISKPEKGFVVTEGNKTYSLNDSDLYLLSQVVACESKSDNRDDILAVTSVILNRAEYNNIGLISEISSGGFSCWGTSKTPNSLVSETVNDALSGIRNNKYYGFRSSASVSYSDNYIIDGGNRFGNW